MLCVHSPHLDLSEGDHLHCSSSFNTETWGDVRRGLNHVEPARLWEVGFSVRIRSFKELDNLKGFPGNPEGSRAWVPEGRSDEVGPFKL